MKTDIRTEYVTRDSILKLLSDDEVARVSNAETAARLADGEEYIDLAHPSRGVRRAKGDDVLMGSVLPKKAVQESTWTSIVAELAAVVAAPSPLPGYRYS